MRRFSLIPVILAACLASTVALAANDRVTATFSSLSAHRVTGDVALNLMSQGGTRIQSNLRNLEPGIQYTALIGSSAGCFVANPSGRASFNNPVSQALSRIGSISIPKVSDDSNVSRATS